MSKWLKQILDEDNTFELSFIDNNSSEEWVFKFIYRESVGEPILIGLTINEKIQYMCSVITEDHLEFTRQVDLEVTMGVDLHKLLGIPSLYKERIRLHYHSESGVCGYVEYNFDDDKYWEWWGDLR